jgi:hypothetical protein
VFRGEVMRAFNQLVGMNQRFITPYHPQANGKVERTVQTVRHTIRKLLESTTLDWTDAVPFVQLTINRKINRRTGLSPFEMMFGREMNGFEDYTNDKLVPVEDMSVDEWREYQDKLVSIIYPSVVARSEAESQHYTEYLDKKRRLLLENKLPTNTTVLLKDPKYVKDDSLKPKYYSMYLPSKYKIIGCTANGAYTVMNMDTGEQLDRKVTIDQMRRISGPDVERPGQNKDDEFEVEAILDERMKGDRAQYLLQWKGYERPSWEWASNVHAPRLKREFNRKKATGKLPLIDPDDRYDSPDEESDDEGEEIDEDDEAKGVKTWKERDRPQLLREVHELESQAPNHQPATENNEDEVRVISDVRETARRTARHER